MLPSFYVFRGRMDEPDGFIRVEGLFGTMVSAGSGTGQHTYQLDKRRTDGISGRNLTCEDGDALPD